MEILVGTVIVALLLSNLILVRWIIVNSSSFRVSKPLDVKPEKPKAKFGGVPFGVKTK